MQTILILLLESGLVFLAIQVSYFGIVLLRVLTFLKTVYLFINVYDFRAGSVVFEAYAFGALYYSLAVSVAPTEDFHYV